MKVKTLIAELSKLDQDLELHVSYTTGPTEGGKTFKSFGQSITAEKVTPKEYALLKIG